MTDPRMSLKDRVHHDEIASSQDSTIVAPGPLRVVKIAATLDICFRTLPRPRLCKQPSRLPILSIMFYFPPLFSRI